MSEEENVITYETFRKFQRLERESQELQKLPEDFYKSCYEWIKRKNEMYEKTKNTMIIKEIENVMSIIKDILDRRERKLLMMAIRMVRSNIPPKNLLPMEAKHFDEIVRHLKEMRESILNIIKGGESEADTEDRKELENQETEKIPQDEESVKIEEKENEIETDSKKDNEIVPKLKIPNGFKLIRILDDIPQFVGLDGRTYGPLKKDDLITLEDKVADLLISKNKAEPIEVEQNED
ncbi:MAG: DNA replication complex GINS family protein [Candidatus Aenigmarchaeota archaeon]|nr:DNA replication complex GINS family protein [Candidatus Aenigmarchaeota archaeon]